MNGGGIGGDTFMDKRQRAGAAVHRRRRRHRRANPADGICPQSPTPRHARRHPRAAACPGAVANISPKGEKVFRIELPTAYPTMVAFGGDEFRTLFITTARDADMSASTENDAYAGELLSVDHEVAGLPEPQFAGP